MNETSGAGPLFGDPKRLLLDMAREHSVSDLLREVVARLTESRRVALARIWLAQPTTECSGCPFREDCRAQTQCLQLVASGGRSAVEPYPEWNGIQGRFQHFAF